MWQQPSAPDYACSAVDNPTLPATSCRREARSFDEAFVEVADGRVSRVHCCIGLATNPATGSQQAYVEARSTAGLPMHHRRWLCSIMRPRRRPKPA